MTVCNPISAAMIIADKHVTLQLTGTGIAFSEPDDGRFIILFEFFGLETG